MERTSERLTDSITHRLNSLRNGDRTSFTQIKDTDEEEAVGEAITALGRENFHCFWHGNNLVVQRRK